MEDAKLERDKLIADMEAKRATGLEKAKREIADRTKYYIQSETEKIRNTWNQKTAHHTLEYRNALLRIREEIEDEVFSRVEARMRDFVESGEYDGYFSALLRLHKKDFAGRHFIIEVSPADMKRKQEILSLCPGSEVQENPELSLGGFIATESGGALRVVESTKSRLERLRENFSEHADLII
jgi:vacuolar-type H+-ATPase subunit E/Vma4